MATMSLDKQQLIFSGTASKKGRHISVTPSNSPLAHLAYGPHPARRRGAARRLRDGATAKRR